MVELDQDVAAFWVAALHHTAQLVKQIDNFTLTREDIDLLENKPSKTVVERGFRTLVLNRTRRGGILAKGAALTRAGENGKGVTSRWYPGTIKKRLRNIARYADRIEFQEGDGIAVLESLLAGPLPLGTAVFVDPPYTAEGKQAGRRLYTHNHVDHAHLFDVLGRISAAGGEVLATYDESPEILEIVARHGFHAVRVVMKNTHHNQISELVITNRRVFLG
jgi:DNA adenine methylase